MSPANPLLLPYWNHTGQVHHLEPYPQSFHEWTLGEEILADHQSLHDAVPAILNHALVRTSCKAMEMNIALDVTLDNDTSVIIRKRIAHISDPDSEKWSQTKFRNELKLIHWLREHSNVPLASILAIGPDFSIQEKMPGSTVGMQWHFFSSADKDHFMTAYVDIVVELFRLPVPVGIGSVSFGTADIMTVGPVIASTLRHSSSEVFDNIFEYFHFLVTNKQQAICSMNAEDKPRAEETLNSLEAKAYSILQGITDPSSLRCVLTHADLHNHNILVASNGRITAVLDWELNLIQPAILGVDYLRWFCDEGPDDPRFTTDNTWWEASPAERDNIRTQFEEMVKERDPQFYKCLIEGRDLRAIVAWLTDWRADPGFDRMRSWSTSQLK